MPIAKITGQGLVAIACSVGLLWGYVIASHIAQRDATVERARIIREVRRLHEQRTSPVSVPTPFHHHRLQVTAG